MEVIWPQENPFTAIMESANLYPRLTISTRGIAEIRWNHVDDFGDDGVKARERSDRRHRNRTDKMKTTRHQKENVRLYQTRIPRHVYIHTRRAHMIRAR